MKNISGEFKIKSSAEKLSTKLASTFSETMSDTVTNTPKCFAEFYGFYEQDNWLNLNWNEPGYLLINEQRSFALVNHGKQITINEFSVEVELRR